MRPWARRAGAGLGFALLIASGLLYFLAGLAVHSSMVPILWIGWSMIFVMALVWRRRPLLVLMTPVVAVTLLVVVIIVAGLLFGRSEQPVH